MEAALAEQKRTGDVHAHRGWIEGLLTHYYDPMYEYQIRRFEERIVFRGDRPAVRSYLSELPSTSR